jgi:deazaflavin-dependent oxidoreductase (nitroreductase family)
MNDFNRTIIEEFRANGGRVGGQFEGAPMLVLHTRGAKSGEPRLNPMVYQDLGGKYAVFASYGGAPKSPSWYHNLVANPDVEIEIGTEIGTEKKRVTARVLEGSEREPVWEKQKVDMPPFAEYEAKTDRTIPVVVLEPVS